MISTKMAIKNVVHFIDLSYNYTVTPIQGMQSVCELEVAQKGKI